MNMRVRRIVVRGGLALVAAGVLGVAGAFLLSGGLREYVYKELTYRLLTDRAVADAESPERITESLNDFVAENVYPGGGPGLDTHSLNDLVRGIGWCDQDAWLLGTLLSTRDIPGRLVFLNGDTKPYAHTMSEVLIDGEWRLMDPLYGFVFRKADGTLATLPDVRANLQIVRDHPKVRALPPQKRAETEEFYEVLLSSSSAADPGRWAPLLEARRGSRARDAIQDAIDLAWGAFGEWGAFRFQDLYLGLLGGQLAALDVAIKEGNRPIMRTEEEDPALFLYYRARNYHLYGRADLAERAYEELLASHPQSAYAEKSMYFLATLALTVRGDAPAAIARMSAFLQKFPETGWRTLAHDALGRAYEMAGNAVEAQRHYEMASEDPFVSAAYRLSAVARPTSGL